MLVEFRVTNFCSLRDEQVLSLVASRDKMFFETHTLPTKSSATPRLLASAVLYGANASGKSNLIKALQYMRSVVLESAKLPPGSLSPSSLFGSMENPVVSRPNSRSLSFWKASAINTVLP